MITKIEIYIIVIAVVTLIGGVAIHSYNNALQRAQSAEAELVTQRQAASDQRAENARLTATAAITDRISANRRSADIKKTDIERMVTDALQKIYAQSPAAVAWRDTPVPGDVLASVRNEVTGAGRGHPAAARAAAGPVDGAHAGTSAAGDNDQRPVAGFRAPDHLPTPELQRR